MTGLWTWLLHGMFKGACTPREWSVWVGHRCVCGRLCAPVYVDVEASPLLNPKDGQP